MPDDLRPLHRAALDDADRIVGRVTPADLARPTPCAGWDLADLLAHMIGQHHGFAAAVRDGNAPAAAYAVRPWTPAGWAESVRTLREAFAAADPGRAVVLVEIGPAALPLRRVVGAQLLDTVVHTWDVARALGREHLPAPSSSRSWRRWRRRCRTASTGTVPARRSPARSRAVGRTGTRRWPGGSGGSGGSGG